TFHANFSLRILWCTAPQLSSLSPHHSNPYSYESNIRALPSCVAPTAGKKGEPLPLRYGGHALSALVASPASPRVEAGSFGAWF
ncbi:hypothetical protein B0H14DRAFT_2755010, partial [Mycena olivaceomarginata]